MTKKSSLNKMTTALRSAAKTAVDVAESSIKMEDLLTSDRTQEQRLEICKSCEYFLKDLSLCDICKCYMPFKTKLKAAVCAMAMLEPPLPPKWTKADD